MTAPDPVTAFTEWVLEDPQEPDPAPTCPVGGWDGHQWALTIEEGQPTLVIVGDPCQACALGLESFDMDQWEMPGIPVELSVRVERSGWPTEVDCVVLDITKSWSGW